MSAIILILLIAVIALACYGVGLMHGSRLRPGTAKARTKKPTMVAPEPLVCLQTGSPERIDSVTAMKVTMSRMRKGENFFAAKVSSDEAKSAIANAEACHAGDVFYFETCKEGLVAGVRVWRLA